jgi:hypothetical protein
MWLYCLHATGPCSDGVENVAENDETEAFWICFFSENSVSSMLTDYNQFLSKNCRGLEEPHVQTNPYVWIFWYFFWMASKTCVSTGAGYIWKLLTLFQMIASSQGERTMGGTEATKFHKVLLHGPALYYIGSKSTMSQQTAIRLSYCWF